MRRAAINHVPSLVLLSLGLTLGVANADIRAGLVGHWPLDEEDGTTASDTSGNDNHGTLNGDGLTWMPDGGQVKGALGFDGVAGAGAAHVEIPTTGISTSTGTVALWANVAPDPQSPATRYMFGHTSTPGSWVDRIQFYMDNSDTELDLGLGDSHTRYTTVVTLVPETWYHIALTWDGSNYSVYVNGQEEASGTHTGFSTLAPIADIGNDGNPQDRSEMFNGLLDEVRAYNRDLTPEEIIELMNWTGGANAGPDQKVTAGSIVTLNGSGPADATSFTWEQIVVADEPTVTLANLNSAVTTFDSPVREIGYVLTFRLTVVSTEMGTTSDEVLITCTAPNEPRLAPGNFRTFPANLGYRLEWDPLVDADDYGVGFKLGPGMYFWFWTSETFYDLVNLTEGQETLVAVRARNSYGVGTISDDVPLLPMRNYALPATLQGINPPSDYVYVISHYDIASLNNAIVDDDNNDSWDGIYKPEDYWGYLWASPLYMDHVTYFTGDMFGDGGWLTSLKVQYTKDGTQWIDVPTRIFPEYDFTDQRQGKRAYTRYDMYIPTLYGMGIRIDGAPGGTASFSSVSELEIYGDNASARPLVVQGVDAEVPERGTGTLDASFSFSTRGDITSMIYEQISGPTVTIEVTGDPLIATFQVPGVDADTELVFQITGSDGTDTLSDDVTITVKNLVTTAVAGSDQGVLEGGAVTLNGSGSLTTTGTLTCQWTQTSGDPVTLNGANTATAIFNAPVIWNYSEDLTFRLDVDDGAGGTSSDETVVTVQNALAYQAWPYTDVAAPTTGYITDVLHLGHNPTDRVLAPLNINSDQLAKWGGEANVRPLPGDLYDFTDTGVTVTRDPMRWTPLHDDQGHFGEEGLDNFQQYYHVNIISPDERAARLHFMNDDEVRFWNNGALIATRDTWDNNVENTDDFTLYEGNNAITIKFEEGTGGNRVRLGITDEFDTMMTDLYVALGPSFPLADAYAVRALPDSYQAGANLDVDLSVRVDPDNKPSSVTVSEAIPGGLTVVDAGGGTVVGGSLNWSFSGNDVATQMLAYTLGVPAGTTGPLNFTGTVSFPTTDSVKGEKVVYEVPSAPQNLDVNMLLGAELTWTANPEEGVAGYRVYRSVNGAAWEEVAFVSTHSYKDIDVVGGSTYNYQVAAENAAGVPGPLSDTSGEQMIKMVVREAEDFNYGGGSYPGYMGCPVAVKAPALDDFGAGYDFFFQSTSYPSPNVYRPDDDVDIRQRTTGEYIIGYTSVGDWWRYTFEVPAPGASDPPGGWVKLDVRVASPGGGTIEFYWDEAPVGSVDFVTGSWGTYNTFPVEDQFQTTPGVHTLRVYKSAGELDIDTIGMGFNWSPPTREDLFFDDFESYTNLYSSDDLVAAGYTVVNTSNPNGAWRLWNTGGDFLGAEDPAIADMTENYAITDTDLAGDVEADEELITPNIDCTNHRRVRLEYNYNYRTYADDTTHAQIAEVDIRTSDDGVTWGGWTNLQRWDTSTVADQESGSLRVDLSALADGKIIQIRFHYYDANFDYWFAVDDIRVSGDKVEAPPVKGKVITIGYVAGVADFTWEAFGQGNYTLQHTGDLTSGTWNPVPGTAWPITATNWSGNLDSIFGQGVYLRVRSE